MTAACCITLIAVTRRNILQTAVTSTSGGLQHCSTSTQHLQWRWQRNFAEQNIRRRWFFLKLGLLSTKTITGGSARLGRKEADDQWRSPSQSEECQCLNEYLCVKVLVGFQQGKFACRCLLQTSWKLPRNFIDTFNLQHLQLPRPCPDARCI